jgi:hypothetical protein
MRTAGGRLFVDDYIYAGFTCRREINKCLLGKSDPLIKEHLQPS